MNVHLLKLIVILSTLLGAFLGILTLIPYVGKITFPFLMCLTAAVIVLLLIKNAVVPMLAVKESVIFGAIIGFISFVAFSLVYLPGVLLLGKFFPQLYGIAVFLKAGGFGIITLMVLFIAVLSAVMNAFSAFLTFYVVDFIDSWKAGK